MRKLIDLVREIDAADEEAVIFVRPEWGPESDAALFPLTEDGHVTDEPIQLGLKYFLEVDIAREVLEEFAGKPQASDLEKCERLIHYAIYDA